MYILYHFPALNNIHRIFLVSRYVPPLGGSRYENATDNLQ